MPVYQVKHPTCGFGQAVEMAVIPERLTCLGCGKELLVIYQPTVLVAYCPGEKADTTP